MPSPATDLNALEEPRAVILDGVEHAVLPVSARVISLMRAPGDEFEKLVAAVALLAPSIAEERRLDLSPKQLTAIVAKAQEGVEEVKASAPNADAPTTTTVDTPTSSPA